MEIYEDWNLSTSEYPQFLLFTQDGDLSEIHLLTEEAISIWYVIDTEPTVTQLLDVLFLDSNKIEPEFNRLEKFLNE